jgi:hypothetical protein
MNANTVRRRPEELWLGEAWRLLIDNLSIWAPLIVIFFLCDLFSTGFSAYAKIYTALSQHNLSVFTARQNVPVDHLFWLKNIATWIVDFLKVIFLYVLATRIVQKKSVEFRDLWPGWPIALRIIGYSIIFMLAMIVSAIFCLVPALFVTALYLPGFALVASGWTISDALKKSADSIKPVMGGGAMLVLVYGIFAVALGCTVIGRLITTPMSYLLVALAARDYAGLPVAGLISVAPDEEAIPGVWPPPASFHHDDAGDKHNNE